MLMCMLLTHVITTRHYVLICKVDVRTQVLSWQLSSEVSDEPFKYRVTSLVLLVCTYIHR